eukprot:2377563-Amphidinium_carterae.1
MPETSIAKVAKCCPIFTSRNSERHSDAQGVAPPRSKAVKCGFPTECRSQAFTIDDGHKPTSSIQLRHSRDA